MAMYVHNRVWQNKINRTLISGLLIIFWTVFIEFYFLFWPEEIIKTNDFVSWLYTDILGFTLILDIFHTIIWGLCFFFTWLVYTIFKEKSNSSQASVSEFIYILALFAFFIIFINSVFVAALFCVLVFGEFFYMYISLANEYE